MNVRYALRTLAKSPGFTLIAITTLALGIGANTAIFTVTNALLLRALPYSSPDRLVLISALRANQRDEAGISLPFFNVIKDHSRSFSDVAACIFETFNLSGHGDPEQIASARTSWNFFGVLGVKPFAGRSFLREEDRPGAAPVVMVGYRLAARLFGDARNAVGRSLTLDSRDFTVVGVLPSEFAIPVLSQKTEIWAPHVDDMSRISPSRVAAGGRYFTAIGRLRPGVSREQARSELTVLLDQYRRAYPGNFDATMNLTIVLDDLRGEMAANARPILLILMAAVGLVLLIACANVASLLLSRALGRKKEFAVRSALGAPRRTMLKQLLIESVLIALGGGAVGIVLAYMGTRIFSTLARNDFLALTDLRMDWRVLGFTLAISITTGILFGLVPALQLSNPDLNSALREEGRGSAGARTTNRARSALVVAQVALSMVLLVGSALLLQSLIRLRSADPGFNPQDLLTMEINLPPEKYSNSAKAVAFYDGVLQRVQRIAGVQAAAISTALPAEESHLTPVLFEGQPLSLPLGQRPIVNIQQISPDYPKTLGVALVAGRRFTEHDNAQTPPVAIVNQTAARRFWPNENAIGKRIWPGTMKTPLQVIGVIADTKNASLAAVPNPEVFAPFPQMWSSFLFLDVRTRVAPRGILAAIRGQIAAVDRDQPITNVQTGEDLLDTSAAQVRLITFLLGLFSIAAMILAVIGIYGAIAYSVEQRTQELGIRMALGANAADIYRLVIGNGLMLAGGGVLIGLVASLGLTRVLSSVLYETSTMDPIALFGSAVLFIAVALLASYIPARKAARIDPARALHS